MRASDERQTRDYNEAFSDLRAHDQSAFHRACARPEGAFGPVSPGVVGLVFDFDPDNISPVPAGVTNSYRCPASYFIYLWRMRS